jgi:hypothetical protein
VRCVRVAAPHCYPAHYQTVAEGESDLTTSLIWERSSSFALSDWNTAKANCAAIGTGWRLPSLTELQTIVAETFNGGPPIDSSAFPNPPTNSNANYWTSSPKAGSTDMAWWVEFVTAGDTQTTSTLTPFMSRCVR